MWRHRFASLLIVGSVSGLAAADTAAEKSAAQLIEQLSDRNFKVREEAAKAIEKLGPAALSALREAKNHPDPEVRRRIDQWIPQFETVAVVLPKQVTLKLANQPLRKAIDELAKQTGYKIEVVQGDPNNRLQKPCTFQLDKTTFWEAFDKICQEGKLTMNPHHHFGRAENTLYLEFADAVTPYVVHHRAFRVAAEAFDYRRETTASRTIQFGAPRPDPGENDASKDEQSQTAEHFQLQLSVAAEPRLEISGVGEPSIDQAVDDQNRSLVAPRNGDADRMFQRHFAMHRFMHRFNGMANSVQIQLLPSARNARSLKVIRGTIPVYAEKEKKTFVVTDDINKAQGKKVELDGLSVQVDLLFKHPNGKDRFDLFLTTSRKRAANEELPDMGHEFELQDAKGNKYEAHGSGSSGDGTMMEQHFSYGGQFRNPLRMNAAPLGPPAKLLYIKRVPLVYHVPFEFKDLTLK
jgi:hypothetical protein